MKESTKHHLKILLEKHSDLNEIEDAIIKSFEILFEAFSQGGKLLVCGNGGSSADSDHIVGELMKGFLLKRTINSEITERINRFDPSGHLSAQLQMALPAINLSAHAALITAISNDNSAEMIFAQQALGYGQKGDVLLGISTSGNSSNVINAAIVAKSQELKTIGLTGSDGGEMDGLFDIVIKVPENTTAGIQELHLPIYHTLCALLEEEFFGKDIGE